MSFIAVVKSRGIALNSETTSTRLNKANDEFENVTADRLFNLTMGEPQKDLEKLRQEQAKEDANVLDELDRESKEFDKVNHICCTSKRN